MVSSALDKPMLKDNTEYVIRAIGIIMAFLSFTLFVQIMLLRKLFTRILRINHYILAISTTLALIGLLVYIACETLINFDGPNASNFIRKELPKDVHGAITWTVAVVIVASFSLSGGTFFEKQIVLRVSWMLLAFISVFALFELGRLQMSRIRLNTLLLSGDVEANRCVFIM